MIRSRIVALKTCILGVLFIEIANCLYEVITDVNDQEILKFVVLLYNLIKSIFTPHSHLPYRTP